MVAILDFIQIAISNELSGHTTMSGIQKRHVDTKIMSLILIPSNIYINLMFDLGPLQRMADLHLIRNRYK